jgi:phosphonate transport system substrate-binding protein
MLQSVLRACLWLLLALQCGYACAADEPALRFGVFPRWNAQSMVREFAPLARLLSTALGREVVIETDKDFNTFMQRVYGREFDLVHLNQLQYLQAHQHAGYTAIAKLCESPECTLRALIVTRADTAVRQIADLRGKTVAFGDRSAMVSYVLAREVLRAHGLPPTAYRTVFTRNPPNALLTVYNGAADAAGMGSPVFRRPEITRRVDVRKLRVLAESEPIAPLPIAVRADLDPVLIRRLQAALQALQATPEGKEALAHIGASHFAASSDNDYAALKPFAAANADAEH